MRSTPIRLLAGIGLMLLVACGVARAAALLQASEPEVQQYIAAQLSAADWQDHWSQKLGEPGPSDFHALEVLIERGADSADLDRRLASAGIASLNDYIALERRLSDIYTMLYGDTVGLAVMAVSIELAVKGAQVSPGERARMVRQERVFIEQQRRQSVAPETIEVISRHALALARALGEI